MGRDLESGNRRGSHCREMMVQEIVEKLYRDDSRRIFATLIRLLGDIDLAEESMHDAFRLAMEQWPKDGIPEKPFAWLVSTARFRGIDRIRKERRVTSLELLEEDSAAISDPSNESSIDCVVPDDQLRLIFICCHPALAADAQVALTLREVCGLTTEEIASAFLTPTPTIAQRIVRAKAKIRDAKIPYQIPAQSDLAERLASVLRVIYLVFNEGYSPSSGAHVTRGDLSQEAIRLTRWLLQLLPAPEVSGLLALMLLHESRREARSDESGNLVPLEEQDRTRWNLEFMTEGSYLVRQS
jgi:RNA polymerase sigma-70 factor (ECF subfamily)